VWNHCYRRQLTQYSSHEDYQLKDRISPLLKIARWYDNDNDHYSDENDDDDNNDDILMMMIMIDNGDN